MTETDAAFLLRVLADGRAAVLGIAAEEDTDAPAPEVPF